MKINRHRVYFFYLGSRRLKSQRGPSIYQRDIMLKSMTRRTKFNYRHGAPIGKIQLTVDGESRRTYF